MHLRMIIVGDILPLRIYGCRLRMVHYIIVEFYSGYRVRIIHYSRDFMSSDYEWRIIIIDLTNVALILYRES